MNRFLCFILVIFALFFLTACGPQPTQACPTGTQTPTYLTVPPEALPTLTPNSATAPQVMKIGGKTISVDKVVEGPLCNDTWSGTVYVTCNIQVYAWKETPDFLKNCNLSVAPDTVVYVAHHNDTAYYKGCSCHTGQMAKP